MSDRLSKFISNSALPVCLAAMDACWMYAVAWLFSTVVLSALVIVPVPTPPALAGLELAAWGLSLYLLDRTSLPVAAVRWVVGVVGVLVSAGVALTFNPQVDLAQFGVWFGVASYSLTVCIALWAVGSYRASQRPGYELVYANFRLGLIVLVLASILAALLSDYTTVSVWEGVGGVAIWFVVWSLCALALGNREALRRETGNANVRFWGGLLIVSVACVVFISSVSGAFTLGGLFGFLGQVVGTIVALALLAIGWLIYGIFWLMSIFRLPIKPLQQTPTPTPTPAPAPQTTDPFELFRQEWQANMPFSMSPEMRAVLTVLVILLLMGIAAWLASRGLSRTRRYRDKDATEERESLGSPWALLFAQLRVWLARLLGKFRKTETGTQAAKEDDLSALEGRPEWVGTLSIRQIYARLQSLAGRLGYPRAPQQTPVEYLSVLAKAMPDLHDDLTGITSAYIEARYGALPIPNATVHAASDAWKRIEPALTSNYAKQGTLPG